jgi:MFS family permease
MLATLRRRDFALVWLAGLISMMGDWVLYIALPIYVYQLTGSALATSAMFAAEMVPALFVGSVAGVFVDRWDRKRTMVAANLLLTIGLLPLLLVHSDDRVWVVYLVSFFESVVAQFFSPAENALLPTLAGKEHLVAANALNALNNNLARLVGPALGGVVAAWFGLVGVTLVDALTFLLAAALVILVTASGKVERVGLEQTAEAAERAWIGVWREWLAGLRLVRRERLVAALIAMSAIGSLGEGVMGVIFVVWVKEVLGGGAQELGWLMSAQAVGGLLGGLAIGMLSRHLSTLRLVTLGPITFALGDIALFTYPLVLSGLWPGLLLIALVGLPAAASGASRTTLMQSGVRDEYRGRVFGAVGTTQSLLRLVGLLIAGALGGRVSPILLLDLFQGGSYLLVGLVALLTLSRTTTRMLGRSQPHVAVDLD